MTHYRSLFHVPDGGPYLLSHSVGCLPRSARPLLDEWLLRPWQEEGSDGWDTWLAAIDRFRGAIAALIGAVPAEICPQSSVSAALTSLLSGMTREAGRDLLLASAHSFPSIGFAMQAFERLGYVVELIPEHLDPADEETWIGRITPHVAAVVPMAVHSNSGRMAPLPAIVAAARRQGALVIADICQATGIVDMNLRALGLDAAIGSCVKWLCGGPGAAFLWVRGEIIAEFAPLDIGWFSHADPFAFDIRAFRHAPDARRFWGGTPSVAPYVLATAGIETIAQIGLPAIQGINRACKAILSERTGVDLHMDERGGTACLVSRDAPVLERMLRDAGCRIDRRDDTLRLSFHAWNDEEEAHRIGGILAGREFHCA